MEKYPGHGLEVLIPHTTDGTGDLHMLCKSSTTSYTQSILIATRKPPIQLRKN